jgi:hypothetical protein
MRHYINTLAGWILLLTSVVLSGQFLAAQEFRSTLTGQVTDPSGAVIASAAVTAVNNATGVTYAGGTTQAGVYFIPYVLPGTYTVTVKAKGFKTAVQENVTLRASQTYGLNFKLELGAVTQEVTITAAPPAIESSSAAIGTILGEREVEDLPLNGRQVYMLLGTTPGSQFTQETFGATGFSGTRGWDTNNEYVIGGALQGYQLFTMNGTNMTMLTGYGPEGSWMTAPNVDAIQEVNVMSQTYDARYGHTMGGTINIVTKAGTNTLHGDFYDYVENGALNANNFENNLNGIPRSDVHQQQYGGTIGGRIKKDKLFYFGSFEGYWENIPFTSINSVPTAAMRTGDFSQSGYQIYDPSTTVCTVAGGVLGNCPGNAYASQEFPGDVITPSRINAIGQALVNLFPQPNINTTSPINNFIANVPDKYRYYQPMVRVDYAQTEKTHWYTTYEYQWGTEFRNVSGFPPPAENGNINTMRHNTVASLDITHTFSPSMISDFKLSFARFIDSFPDGPLSTPTPSSIGLNMPSVKTTTKQLLPEIGFTEQYANNGPTGAWLIGNAVTNDVYQNMIFDADLTKTHGAHTFEFGGEIGDYYYANPASVGHPNGDFTFGTDFTQYNPTNRGAISASNGNVIADLLLGAPDSGGVDWNDTLAEGFPIYSIYGQDNWRVNHRLTLQIGLRYDMERGVRDRYNRLNRGICTTCINPITNNATYQANVSNPANIAAWTAAGINPASLTTVYGGLLFPGVSGQTRDAYNNDYGNLAPRVGFAYALNNKTVIRGGWGWVFAYGIEAGTTEGFSITTPYISTLNGITPDNYFQSGTPFPSGAQQPIGTSQGLLTGIGDSFAIDFPQRKIPRSTIMSLGIQRELPGHMTLDVSYAGNYARALRQYGPLMSGAYWINTIPYSTGYNQLQQNTYNPAVAGALVAQVPNPYWGVLPPTTAAGSAPTVLALDLMVPFSEYGACPYCANVVGTYTDPYGKSWFDALEVKLNKRLTGTSRGLSFQLAYTYSKTMESADYRNGWPWVDPHPIYEPISYDRTHVFTLSGEWDLPFGRGSKYALTQASGVLGQIVNNWRLSWLFSDSTGFPEGITSSQWYVGTHSYVPNGGPTFGQWIYNCGSAGPLSCWTGIPLLGQGNLPDVVGYLRQPYIPNLDLSLQKDFRITESKRLQFRAEAFNFMNTPLFPGPDSNPYDGPPVQNPNGTWSGFGTISFYQQNFPRMVQLSLKFLF